MYGVNECRGKRLLWVMVTVVVMVVVVVVEAEGLQKNTLIKTERKWWKRTITRAFHASDASLRSSWQH